MKHSHSAIDHAPHETARQDPVCGMTVHPSTAAGSTEYDGRTWYFCSPSCQRKFENDPQSFAGPPATKPAPAPAPAGTGYTCPMHPEIVRDGPGNCPICGMALEPRVATGAEEDNPELRTMTRRFWISAALSLPLLALMAAEMFHVHLLGGAASLWLQFALATPVVLWGGLPFFQRGWASVRNRNLNMFTLI